MHERALTFELPAGDELEIHGDTRALRSSGEVLDRPIRDGGHEHLTAGAIDVSAESLRAAPAETLSNACWTAFKNEVEIPWISGTG